MKGRLSAGERLGHIASVMLAYETLALRYHGTVLGTGMSMRQVARWSGLVPSSYVMRVLNGGVEMGLLACQESLYRPTITARKFFLTELGREYARMYRKSFE